MRWPWSRRASRTDETPGEARKGASDQYRAAQGQSGEVSRVVDAATRVVRRTDRFVKEAERSLHLRGSA